ncbi:MAG: adenylate/guanylate cyclase domain-containing protein [Terriglobales bacterium]
MAESTETGLSELLRERLRLDVELSHYQQAVTVLFVDIVGSTRFYEQHGDVAGLAMVQQFFDKLVPIVEQQEGTVVKTIGDAILARFPTAVHGTRCALAMQFGLLQHNLERPPVEQIHIRVALNSGFALIKGTDVFGDVVNVCSRIESAAKPDDILISPSVYDQICQHGEFAVRKRAESVQLKGKTEKLDLYEVVWEMDNPIGPAPPRPSVSQVAMAAMPQAAALAEVVHPQLVQPQAEVTAEASEPQRSWPSFVFVGPVLAIMVLALGLAASFWPRSTAPVVRAAEGIAPSIAVLPFVDLSAEKNQEYFSDGLAEELLNDLTKVPGLRVAARTSSFQFKGKTGDLREVGEKLNVAAILEGSVRKEGRRVRITAQLIKTADGFHLWSETYDRQLNDIFAVQEEIARSVAASLKMTLLEAKSGSGSTRAGNSEAYTLYLQGRYFLDRRTKEGLEKAIGCYEQAVKLDPGYAAAWAGLAAARSRLADSGYVPLDRTYAQARQAAARALELDPDFAEAHAAMGSIQQRYDWDWTGADSSYKKALELEPGNAAVIRGAAEQAIAMGRLEDALVLDRRAANLDPLGAATQYSLALHAYFAGHFDEAIAASRKALELSPGHVQAHMLLGNIYLAQARPQDALTEIEKEPETVWRLFGRTLTYHALGRKKESDAALAEIVTKFHEEAAYQIAEACAFRGEADCAFKWLDKAYAQRDGGLTQMKGDLLLKKLEHDPRYAAFLKKMRLPS